ncbi:hypothetical protein ES703_58105 [subsurface metagenome]
MRRISNKLVCFVVSLKEVKKYGRSPLDELKRNPEAKLLFSEKVREVKNNASKGNS